jgi:SAM-dependent methyltransferase
MELKDYIESLKHDEETDAYIELDKEREIRYIEGRVKEFERIVSAIPLLPEPIRILDIGPTPFTLFIKKRFPTYDIFALDRTPLLEERLKKAGIQLKICDLDEGHIPYEDEFFDIVIFTEVLEHIFEPPTNMLKEIKRIMLTSGKLIIEVPNIACLSKRIKLLFGVTPLPDADHQMNKDWIHGHGHVREYTYKEILSLCKSVGFEILEFQMRSRSPFEVLRNAQKFNFSKFLYCCVTFFIPQFRSNIYVECRKGASNTF